MMSRKPVQELTAGDGGINYQAAGDIINNGPSRQEVQDIALGVYRANALELRGIAEDIAFARAERVTNDFLNRLMDKDPEAAKNLADPDIQSVMFEAQKEYARSGEEDLAKVLVELLADRTIETERSLRTLVLNEAISSVPKLTEQQRRAIGLVFLLRYSRWTGKTPTPEDYFREFVVKDVLALGKDLPTSGPNYQHIEYVGAGTVSISSFSFGSALRSGVEGLFTRGFTMDDVPQDLRDAGQIQEGLVPCLRSPERYQVAVMANQDIPALAKRLGFPHLEQPLINLAQHGLVQDHEVVEEATAFDERILKVSEAWGSTPLQNLTLTSVGIAIGHTYWRRVTEGTAPLSVWL
ncbi:LPO_1073/Vpar_1526 family protein [Pseudarthrobacter sp. N5]|uniref:LPO_1073/Vpar_1526 family protein n=1 Tax=Pseudarthrobacter sp. N5 TaxID=3418416 RepID=UPI003CEED8E1